MSLKFLDQNYHANICTYSTPQRTGELEVKTAMIADLVRHHRLTDALNWIEHRLGYTGETALALLSFLTFGGDSHA